MTHQFAKHMFTENVRHTQAVYGSRDQNDHLRANFGPNDKLTEREATFITQRDSFYLATVTETGWPYVQHRGGPAGFVHVLNSDHIAYADYKGNTQLISTGNANGNSRCSIILLDYPSRRRLKLIGHLSIQDVRAGVPTELEQLVHNSYQAKIERVATIKLVAYDWNCPQHITPRFTQTEFAALNSAAD